MIKILSGIYKGRNLKNIKIKNIRPTQSRVKKSMMDKLMPFNNKTILDLFAGVGTLGIEAISRGAKSVCFVEKNLNVIKLLKKNLDMLSINENCQIRVSDGIDYLKFSNERFDVIFADPPYYKYDFIDLIHLVTPLLLPGGIFCFESEKKNIETDLDVEVKKYGGTQVVFWRKK